MTTRMGVSLLLTVCFAASGNAGEPPAEPRPISPTQVIRPFNGRDLSGFASWLRATRSEDPRGIFSVVDGSIRISGEGAGYLATNQSYENYHLSVEYRWGQKTDGSGNVRNSGILLHAVGPDGGAKGVWKTAIEVQLAQGCEGDLIVIRGNDEHGKIIPATLTSDTVIGSDGRTRWSPNGKKTVYSGKQFWWSNHQAGFEERLDTRGEHDVASALGEWTRVDCICAGDRNTVQINGTTVNECYDMFPAAGRILLQNEGSEIYFRNLELRPLSGPPHGTKPPGRSAADKSSDTRKD
jgi:Domain of Unknown Function (DUF1080)